MQTFKISFLLCVLAFVNFSVEGQDNSLSKWQLGLNINSGINDWRIISENTYQSEDMRYGIGVSVNYRLSGYFSLRTGLQGNLLKPLALHPFFCPTGSEHVIFSERGSEVRLPLALRIQSNKKRALGVHFDTGMQLGYLSGEGSRFFSPQEEATESYNHLFAMYNFGLGLNYRINSRFVFALTLNYTRGFTNQGYQETFIDTGGLNLELLYALAKKK